MKRNLAHKLFSVVTGLSLLVNSLATPLSVYAQESPTPTPTDTPTATPTETPTATATPIDSAIASPQSTEAGTPTPTDLVTPTPTESATPTTVDQSTPTTPGPPSSSSPSSPSTATPTATVIGTTTPQTENGKVDATILKNVQASSVNEFDVSVQTDGSATLTTNKADYSPTDTVLITGTGFIANKTYTIEITSQDPPAVDFKDQVKADNKGDIIYSYQLDGTMRPNYAVYIKDGERIVATTTFTDTPPPPSAGIDLYSQCSNNLGTGYTSGDTGCRWTNGNLNNSNSKYFEGDATPQRLAIQDLITGDHTVTISYDTTKNGKHAYDFIADDKFSESWITDADMCDPSLSNLAGCSGLSPNDSALIPTDINAGGHDTGAGSARHFRIRNGTWVSGGILSGPTLASGSYGSDSETTIQLKFHVDASTCSDHYKVQSTDVCEVLITFGAHVSSQADWGAGNSAVNISGSPYHVALVNLDGNPVGGRDNQMAASAITGTPSSTITIHKVTSPGGGTGFGFTTTGGLTPSTFSLNDGGAQSYTSVVPGSYTIVENDPSPAYALTGLICGTVTGTGTSATPNLGTRTVSITIGGAGGGNVDCTYTNTQQNGTLTVNKVLSPAQDPGLFNLQIDGQTQAANVGNGGTTGGVSVSPGSHTVGETAGTNTDLADYTRIISGDCDSQGNVSVPAGTSRTCTITNTRNTGTIIVDKQVDTNGDGTYEVTTDAGANALGFQWGLDLESPARNFGDSLAVTTNVLHQISETSPAGYHFIGSLISTEPSSCNGINPNPSNYPVPFLIPNPGNNTRHILLCNARDTGTLIVHKTFTDQHSNVGISINLTWTGDFSSGVTDGNGDAVFSGFNTSNIYTAHASPEPQGYYESGNTCVGVSLTNGQTTNCTITDSPILGTITVNKTVSGGTAVPSQFCFTLDPDPEIGQVCATDQGLATFNNVPFGTYSVNETQSVNGYSETFNDCSGLSISQNGDSRNCDVINSRDKGKISGIKFDDINGDGEFDPQTEDILADWTINLYKDNDGDLGDLVDTQVTTNPDGYEFDNVPTGSYFVCEVLKDGWTQTLPVSNGGCYQINLTRNGQWFQDEDFGNFIFASISGHKFNDLNGNGDWEEGEPPLSNWTFQLQRWNGEFWSTVDTSVTDGAGNWAFNNLGPGKYRVHEVLKSGWHPTNYTSGYYPNSLGINVFSGEDLSGKDFGNRQNKLTIYKRDQDGQLLGGATFRICPEEFGDCFTVTDNGEGDSNPDPGIIEIDGLADDFYTITESQAPQGYLPDEGTCERDINVESTQVSCSFFNELAPVPNITISKSNDKSGGTFAGDTVTYTLVVTNGGNVPLFSVNVTDALPGGFTYVSGSSTLDGAPIADPSIAGGVLTWNIGTLTVGPGKTLVYKANIASDLADGTYKNFATCKSFTRQEQEADCNVADSSVPLGHGPSYGGNLTPQVLGASTVLPASGSDTAFLAFAVLAGAAGVALKLGGKKRKYGKN